MKIYRRNWILGVSGAAVAGIVGHRRLQADEWNSRLFEYPAHESRPVISALCYDPRTARLASAGDDHLVRVWDVRRGSHLAKLPGHRDWVRCVAQHADALLSGSNDRTIRRWNWKSLDDESSVIWRGASPVVEVAFSPDGRWFAACCFAGDVHWFSTDDWQRKGQVDCRHADLRCLAFSPDSQHLVAAGRDGVLHVVDLAEGGLQREVASHHRRRRDVLFLDANQVLSVGDDGLACWIDIGRPDECRDLRCERGRIYCVARIDQQRVAVAGSENLIHVWNLERREREAVLSGHLGTVTSLVWTGTELISAGYDTTIRAWKSSQAIAVGPPTPVIR